MSGAVNNGGNLLSLAAVSSILISGQDQRRGGLTVNNGGTHTLSGTLANTYTGATTVNGGTLVLQKTASVAAVSNNLVIGDGVGTDTVQLGANEQIATGSTVTVNSSAYLISPISTKASWC
jgi:autotransporter-associated beta strand protein